MIEPGMPPTLDEVMAQACDNMTEIVAACRVLASENRGMRAYASWVFDMCAHTDLDAMPHEAGAKDGDVCTRCGAYRETGGKWQLNWEFVTEE